MVWKFTAKALAVLLLCWFTTAKEAHKHVKDTIDIDDDVDEPQAGFAPPGTEDMEGYQMDEGSGSDGDEEEASGSGGGDDSPDIVPMPTRPKTTRKPTTHRQLTPCQQLKESSPAYKDSYVPRCTSSGQYEKTQCRGNKECWCVNPSGKIITGTVKGGHINMDKPDCEGGSNLSPCVYMKVKQEWQQLLGTFIPRCTGAGDFEEIQCREMECWCVDGLGRTIDGTLTLRPDQPNCNPTTRSPVTEPPVVTKMVEPVKVTQKSNELGNIEPEEEDDETNIAGKEAEAKGDPGTAPAPSIMGQPGILAGIIGGAVVGLLCAILLVMFIVYRMRKKDEGSYALDEPTKARGAYAYQKAPDREFYA